MCHPPLLTYLSNIFIVYFPWFLLATPEFVVIRDFFQASVQDVLSLIPKHVENLSSSTTGSCNQFVATDNYDSFTSIAQR